MTVGTGIFLAAVSLSLVWLYSITRERWQWKTILKRTLTLSSIVIALSCAYLAFQYWRENRLEPPKQIGGFALGMNYTEMQYVGGVPTIVYVWEDGERAWKEYQGPEKARIGKRTLALFDLQTYLIEVHIDRGGKTEKLVCQNASGGRDCPPVLGVAGRATEDQILERLGKPDTEEFMSVEKRITYRDLNLVFFLQQRRVVSYSIGNTASEDGF